MPREAGNAKATAILEIFFPYTDLLPSTPSKGKVKAMQVDPATPTPQRIASPATQFPPTTPSLPPTGFNAPDPKYLDDGWLFRALQKIEGLPSNIVPGVMARSPDEAIAFIQLHSHTLTSKQIDALAEVYPNLIEMDPLLETPAPSGYRALPNPDVFSPTPSQYSEAHGSYSVQNYGGTPTLPTEEVAPMDDIEYVDAPEEEAHVVTARNSPRRSHSVTPSLEKKLTETIPSRQARIDDDEESDEEDEEDDMEVVQNAS